MRSLPTPNDRPKSHGPAAKPFRTLAHALKQFRPGDTLYLRAGTYRFGTDVR
jgi:hypothetical protein